MNKDKTLIMIDASAMRNAGCMLALFNTVFHGYRGARNSIQIEWGQAFHKFRAIFRQGGMAAYGKAVKEAVNYLETTPYTVPSHKKYLTDPKYLKTACSLYSMKYMDDDITPAIFNGQAAIELPFCLPYYVDDEIEVLLAGTMDELGTKKSARMNLEIDCKTTGKWDVQEFLREFLLSGQLLFYRSILRMYSRIYDADPIKNAKAKPIADFHKSNPALMIDCINTKGADTIELLRSSEWLVKESTLDEYDKLRDIVIYKLIHAIKHYLHTGEEPLREGMVTNACDGRYDKCQYHAACSMVDCASRQEYMDIQFVKRFYNPLNFSGEQKE